jgi:hypothetical protein
MFKKGSALEIWAVRLTCFAWSRSHRKGTHNPLVAGSSPARPTGSLYDLG